MSKEELDSLFRNKLQDHTEKPSDNAWERLSDSLPGEKKASGFRLWYIAAAVLLLLVAGYLVLTPGANTQIAEETAPEDQPSVTREIEPKNESIAEEDELEVPMEEPQEEQLVAEAQAGSKSNENNQQGDRKSPEETTNNNSHNEPVQEVSNDVQLAVADPVNPVNPVDPVSEELPGTEIVASNEAVNTTDNKEENATLRISIEEFDEALLADEKPVADSSSAESSGLKKLWAAVKKAPSSIENGFGDLREAKNELLSFNKEDTE